MLILTVFELTLVSGSDVTPTDSWMDAYGTQNWKQFRSFEVVIWSNSTGCPGDVLVALVHLETKRP